jgi:hypothetical protein
MRFTTSALVSLLLATSALAGPLSARKQKDDDDSTFNIFKNEAKRWEGAICKTSITRQTFPALALPEHVGGGCVRYFRGVDMTGVVTEVDLFFADGIQSACDCAARCLAAPASCTNWVFKHTFNPAKDAGRRSCTLYSSPNLPSAVTLAYNLPGSAGFANLNINPQPGGMAPFTFEDPNLTKQDPFGVSGFVTQDQNGKLYC